MACVLIENAIFANAFSQLQSLIGAGLTSHLICVIQIYHHHVGTCEIINLIWADSTPFAKLL